MKKLVIVLLLWGGFAGTAMARTDCQNAYTQREMNHCSALDLDEADRQINATYADVRKHLSPDRREKLRQVQLAWITFKELNCELESLQVEGGSMQPLMRNACLTSMTEARNKELQSIKEILSH